MRRRVWLTAALFLGGCAAQSSTVDTLVLKSSGLPIDIVQHRSSVEFADCGTLVVLQTFSKSGQLIDSKEARGTALHCSVIPAAIDAGGRVGGAYVGATNAKAVVTNIGNSVSNSIKQAQSQGQLQGQQQFQKNSGGGGHGGNGGGNNGGGNGGEDGTNNGTDNHHDNGDND